VEGVFSSVSPIGPTAHTEAKVSGSTLLPIDANQIGLWVGDGCEADRAPLGLGIHLCFRHALDMRNGWAAAFRPGHGHEVEVGTV